jgi:hypothetical protein
VMVMVTVMVMVMTHTLASSRSCLIITGPTSLYNT